ncbi:aminophospholipid translocase [Entomophthora muscae]|uniref:Aminophospholipid translocase n=1 Tax=Entomophthora muscae TaxID=34485 RepID=A0ACC2RH82_9FUNG|nr:aminophospholipid translocase [Entomophthora muscae]
MLEPSGKISPGTSIEGGGYEMSATNLIINDNIIPNAQSPDKVKMERPKQSPSFKSRAAEFFQTLMDMANRPRPSVPRDIYINNPSNNIKFLHNSVSTSKYNLLTFLPKFLFEQFSNYANVFFLFTAAIQQIPDISPTNRWSTLVPLIVVLFCTGVKELIEDIKRHQSDNETNSRITQALRNGAFVDAPWKQLKVGDIVRVQNFENFPADLVLLSSSEPEGLCYIETSNLDGETNLKVKQALTETAELVSPQQITHFRGMIKSEGPNDSLYTYTGTMVMQVNGRETSVPLDPTQVLLRGAMLRNTTWVYAAVVFTGHDTKLMRNATAAPIKMTSVVRTTNVQIAFLFGILLTLALFCSIGNLYLQNTKPNELAYLFLKTDTGFETFGRNLLTFIILLNNLIPISLIVTMEVVKYHQADLINSDLDMYYAKSDTPALARTSSLVEELGQIEYIFSDKTGTLTCNEMEFKECIINGVPYVETIDPSKVKLGDQPDIPKRDFATMLNEIKAGSEQGACIDEFFTLLSTCHTVIPERKPDGQIVYQAASPDEGALVEGAAALGYSFTTRKPKSVTIERDGEPSEYQLLNVCEFNSTRKRMSAIFKCPDGSLKLYIKGADTVILERLSKESANSSVVEKTLTQLEDYASDGLRTLCIAMREIGHDEYEQWIAVFNKASTTLVDRGEELDKAAELIEKDLVLLGATAIEDKLQDGVPETIFTLAQAGIKIWVLTGDRQETAINIGFSCKLLQEDMSLMICNEETPEALRHQLENRLQALEDGSMRNAGVEALALVIDGKSLNFALEKDCEKLFYDLAVQCKAVICCRVSPLQKALVVKLVKRQSSAITLAIGDGANDVSMIQAAHVGVGINGMEGLQAARSSDFAISQFRFLRKLLLVHGAWSYQRLSRMILFSFYKNICLNMTQFWFTFSNGFSGQTVYESWTNTFYNVVFTVMPPLMIGIFDQHLSARMLDRYPEMYKIGQKKLIFNVKTFWGSTSNAIAHSLLLYLLITTSFGSGMLMNDGKVGGYEFMSVSIYASVLITVLCKAALITDNWTKYTVAAIPGSLLIFIVVFSMYGSFAPRFGTANEYNGMVPYIFGSGYFWMLILIMPCLCLSRDYSWKYIQRMWRPRSYHIVQEIQKFNIPDYRPRMERFRKAVHKVRMIQRMRKGRGYAFSQNEGGQTDVIRSYDTTRIKPQG